MTKKKQGGFTLVEILITIVIMAILIGLVFEIFVTIGRIAVFVQLNRSVHGELIYVAQTIQNMVDEQDMQLTGLAEDSATFGRGSSVQFADNEFTYQIRNECESESEESCFLQLYWLGLDVDPFIGGFESGSVALTDARLVDITSFATRVLPYTTSGYENILHKGFRLFIDMRVPQYDESKRRYRVQQKSQLFFTMRKYE